MKLLFCLLLPFCSSTVNAEDGWAEKALSKMTLDEKVGQLFVAPACPLAEGEHWEHWKKAIHTWKVGNAIVKQSTPLPQVKFLNRLQRESPWPMLIAADAEWGLAMRMPETIAFPKNGALGRIGDLDLIYAIGQEIGLQAKRVGVYLNLSPVADVNNNPDNPVIGERSFGANPQRVALCVSACIRGLQSSGILACAKHFPGHGDTNIDSHRELPVIAHSKKRLDAVELIPFRQAIEDGVAAIMSAHLLVPCIDIKNPTSLSSRCLTDLLQEEMGFEGLVITDALNMKALNGSPEEIALAAYRAGSDLLLYGSHLLPEVDSLINEAIPRAITALKNAFLTKELSPKTLDQRVLKILRAKERVGLHQDRFIKEDGLIEALHSETALKLQQSASLKQLALDLQN